MDGNKITYYDRNFIDRERNPEIEAEYIYGIWEIPNGYGNIYHIASFRTREQLDAFAKMLDFEYEFTTDESDFKEGRISKKIVRGGDTLESDALMDELWKSLDNPARHREIMEKLEEGKDDICNAYHISRENLARARRIKSLSNGHIVDNLYTDDGETIRIYECNPNYKKFYKPLPLDEHIAYEREHGVY